MRRQNQWLFEAPLSLQRTHPPNKRFNQRDYKNAALIEWETQTVVLQSDRFRGDQRLQAAANNSPPLRQGERSNAVSKLQQALIDLGYPMPITTKQGTQSPDGIYGNETTITVRKFQRKYGLKADGIAGRATLSKLDQLSSAPVPLSSSDQQIIEQALQDSQNTLQQAISSLTSLELAITSGLIKNPAVQAMHQRTVDAVQSRLHVELSDSRFLPTIQRAKQKLINNLNRQRQVGNQVKRNDFQCRSNEANRKDEAGKPAPLPQDSAWAWTDANGTITIVCSRFFASCPECRRDVLTHEFFHQLGLPGEGGATNTEEALMDANEMAQLVSHIVTGSTDACPKWLDGQPCGQPLKFRTSSFEESSKTCNLFPATFTRAAQFANVPISWASNPSLCNLVRGESGWNPSAKNPSSSAFGLFQFLTSTWKKFLPESPYGTIDPYWQAVGGFRYIKAAYRTPERAWGFWQATVKKNVSLAPPDLQSKAQQWISKGWSGY
jgi:peptidoglycan hydrolase-like protein with peptidoglycan-binding domain